MEIKFVIPGDPVERVKFHRPGNSMVWDDYKRENHTIKMHIEDQMAQQQLLTGPLLLDFSFFIRRPRSIPRKPIHSYSMGKPYVDGMIRMYLECLEGLVFTGYQHVTSLKACKVYDTIPRTEVVVTKI